eukprot:scaffold324860_cov21-Tisochrysis_lutea.AAC.1
MGGLLRFSPAHLLMYKPTEARFVTVTHCNAQHVLQLNVQIAGLVNLSSDDVLRLQSVLGKGAWGT